MTDFASGHRAISDRTRSGSDDGTRVKHRVLTGIIAMLALIVFMILLTSRSYTMTVAPGGSLAQAFNDHYNYAAPTAAVLRDNPEAQKRLVKINLKTLAVAQACHLRVYERPLGATTRMPVVSYEMAKRHARDTGVIMMTAPVYPGDVIKVGPFGGYSCVKAPHTKDFADRT